MPCKTDLFECPECCYRVYDLTSNDSDDHASGCLHYGTRRDGHNRPFIASKQQVIAEKTLRKRDYKGMLCEALKLLEEWTPEDVSLRDKLLHYDHRLLDFLDEHEELEAKKTKQEALAKLTPRERRALGFK